MKKQTTGRKTTKPTTAATKKAAEALSSADVADSNSNMAVLLAKMTEMQQTMDAQQQATEELSLRNKQLTEEKQSIIDQQARARQGAVPDDLRENQLNAFLSHDTAKSADKNKRVFSSRGQTRRHIRIVLETESGTVDRTLPVNITLSSTKNGSLILNAFVQTSDDYGKKTLVTANPSDPLGSFIESEDGTQVDIPRNTSEF